MTLSKLPKIIRREADSLDYYVIAEIGVNHENSRDTAKLQMRLAREGGADAVKFQTYKAHKLAARHSPAYWDTSKEPTLSQFELFQKYDSFDKEDYRILAEYAADLGVDFMSTPFDIDSVVDIDPLVPAHKIASADLTNVPLLRKIAAQGKPVIVSTGAASMVEIKAALRELNLAGCVEIALLHCVLNYPTPDSHAHLARMGSLAQHFGNKVVLGYSDHTLPHDGCLPVLLAYTLGARVIEKHFTHDKSLPGNDHYHAMDTHDLRALRTRIDRARELLGSGVEDDFLMDQKAAIQHARRSIVAASPLRAGEVIRAEHLIAKRPGTGISPTHWDSVIGMIPARDIPEDDLIQWSDLKAKEI